MATSSAWAFSARGADTDTLTIDIFDVVGLSYWEESTTAKGMRRLLANSKAKTIALTVNSRGGDVTEGMAIYAMLHEHPAKIVADVPGLAGSIASIILMAADEISIAEGAMIMIHNAWGAVMGKPDDMRKHADKLDAMSDAMAGIYAARTGQTKAKVAELMKAETWLSAAEAKELGFADKVKPAKKGKAAAASARAFAMIDLSGLQSVPDAFARAVASAREEIGGDEPPMQNDPEPASVSEGKEQHDMAADDVKTVLATLGVASVGDAASALALLRRIETATGKSGDEAHGLVLAALASHAELPKAQARITELERAGETNQLETAIATAKKDGKMTPAIEASVRAQYEAKEITLKGAVAWLSNLAAIPALARGAAPGAAGQEGANPPAPTWNGKTYADLKPVQRAQLKKEDPTLFEAMRSSAQN